jgi:hypothetical protein
MNLFILDTDPIKAAQLQCDKHVVKMIVESGQMLSTVHRMLDGTETKRPSKSGKTMVKYWEHPEEDMENVLYKAVHINHPCTIWSRESIANYIWHYNHFEALCDEYKYRYNKEHATDTLLRKVLMRPPINISEEGQTPFKLAMKSNPECMFDDPVKSYQAFYKTKKDRFKMVWTKRDVPEWFTSDEKSVIIEKQERYHEYIKRMYREAEEKDANI